MKDIKTRKRIEEIKESFYTLNEWKYKDYCLLVADIANNVLPYFEKVYPKDNRPRKCIEGIRLFERGLISDKELNVLKKAAALAEELIEMHTDKDTYVLANAAAEAAQVAVLAADKTNAYEVAEAAAWTRWNVNVQKCSVKFAFIAWKESWEVYEDILKRFMDSIEAL